MRIRCALAPETLDATAIGWLQATLELTRYASVLSKEMYPDRPELTGPASTATTATAAMAAGAASRRKGRPTDQQLASPASKADDEEVFISGALKNRAPNNLTGTWRLFVDNSNIASMEHVQRVSHQFAKHTSNPVALKDAFLYGTVLPAAAVPAAVEKDRYWMWYSIADAFAFGIARSADGFVWDKPALCRPGPGCTDGGVCERCGTAWSEQTALVYDKSNPNMFWTRTNSNSKLGGLCTSLNETRGPPKYCRDTDMSLVYTPWDTEKKFKLFNFNYGQDKEPSTILMAITLRIPAMVWCSTMTS